MADLLDVVVIGAGISGLCAAHLLQTYDRDLKIVVLEARDRVGGRTQTFKNTEVKYVDLGGSYVLRTQNHVLRVAKNLGIETHKVFNEGKVTEHFGEKPAYFDGDFSTWNILAIFDYYHQIRELGRMCAEIPLLSPWEARNAVKWDTMTVREYFDKSCWTTYAKRRMYQIFHETMRTEPYDISLLYYLWYLKTAGGVTRIADRENAGSERKFIGGSQQISEKLAKILGEKVILSSPVCKVDQKGGNVTVKCMNEKMYKTRYVISAMPQALLQSVSFVPPLSPMKNQLIQRVLMGSSIKTITYYENAWWRDQGLSGVLIAGSESGPVFAALDDSKPDGSYPALIGFIRGEKARYWSMKSSDERKQAVCEQYSKAFNNDKALTPRYYMDKNWLAEKYSDGCFVSVMPCGVLTHYGEALRRPEENVYFAGTETAIVWAGNMDGAVEAGERAARQVLHAMGRIPKEEIYQVKPASEEFPPRHCDLTKFQLLLPSVPMFLMVLAFVGVGSAVAVLRHQKVIT